MPTTPVRIPSDIPPSLASLIDLFYSDALRVRGVDDITVQAQVRYLFRFFRYLGPVKSGNELASMVSPESISVFLAEYTTEHRSGSVRWMQVSLRSFLHFAYRLALFDRDLSVLVPVRSSRRLANVPRSLPDECIARLREGLDRSSPTGLRDSAIICLLAVYGIRGVQIRRLQLNDLDWRNDHIHFSAAKGGRPIDQHLMPEVGNLLSEYIRVARPNSAHPEVFLTHREPFHPLPSARYLSRMISRHITRLGIVLPAGVSHGSHGFRHAFACRMVGKVPFKDLVDQLGHCNPASTLIYSKVDLGGLRQAALPWPGGEQ